MPRPRQKFEIRSYIRGQVKTLRDGYATTPSQRKAFYLFLKANEAQWNRPSMREVLGAGTFAWVEGLVEYGDSHGWLDEFARKQRGEVMGNG